jgi:hypothetical protein
MTASGYYCYWYMPFASSAVLELVNDDAVDRKVEFEIMHAPLGRPFQGLGHFHAKWHRDTVELPADRWPDWIMLQTEGRGRFCGVTLHVWNPRGGWWGEGDEKFFVDGEKFPSTIGTGSEDYFGYAWCNPHLFQKSFHAQTMTQNNQGHQSVLRWHILDNVPFQKSFQGCIEKYFKNDRGTLYAVAAFWYLAPDGRDPYGPVPVAQRDGYYETPDVIVNGIKVLKLPPGDAQVQEMGPFGEQKWTHGRQIWWTGAQPGDKLEIDASAPQAGKYQIMVGLTKAPDYGVVQFRLDGAKAGKPIDLYDPAVIPSGPIALGEFDLAQGHHKLTVEIIGANPKAHKSYMFGIHSLELKPVQ